jgi:hypothetical protein
MGISGLRVSDEADTVLLQFFNSDILEIKENAMAETKPMSFDEKVALRLKSIELEKAGNFEEADRLFKQIPLPPYLAKSIKEVWKAGDWLKESGYNLSEAEAAYGPGWLNR